MNVNEWVKEARSRRGWTQQQLADEVGVTKANVSGWETQRHKPSFRQMAKISQLTGMALPVETEQAQPAPSPQGATRMNKNVDAELAAVQVMLLALVNTHPDKAALLRAFDAIVSGIRMHAHESGGSGPSEEMQGALTRFRNQVGGSIG